MAVEFRRSLTSPTSNFHSDLIHAGPTTLLTRGGQDLMQRLDQALAQLNTPSFWHLRSINRAGTTKNNANLALASLRPLIFPREYQTLLNSIEI